LPAVAALGELEGVAGDTRAGPLGGDLHAHHHAGRDFVLDAAVQPFGILADDDQVDAGESRGDTFEVADRANSRVKIELLAEADVDGGETATDWCGARALEGDAVLA